MPIRTRAETYQACIDNSLLNLVTSLVLESDNDSEIDSEDEEEIGDLRDDFTVQDYLELTALDWMAIAESFYSTGPGSRGPYDQIPKSKDFFSCCLQAPDRAFRHMFRVGRDTFDRLVELLAQNPIFTSTGRRPQRHVKYQLGTFLIRYASRGSDTLWVSQKLSIGFGTVFIYCRRVTRAIRQLRGRFLAWMTPQRKVVVSEHIQTQSGLKKCVGCGDGSLVPFMEQPAVIGPAFKSRKKFFGVCTIYAPPKTWAN
ncbi:hypothetical protein C8Q79DRAFT_928866 [Trametes meyenii]|nr:hypothetical protein C8Q79DRAFT_928866 [Trametes meyenii]